MKILTRAYVLVSAMGAVHAVRRGRTARFAGLQLPGSPAVHAATIGSPLSAPPLMLFTLLEATRRRRTDVIGPLALLFLVGLAGEADTLDVIRHPAADPGATACVALEVALPLAMLVGVSRAR